jgi:hypothetical protein
LALPTVVCVHNRLRIVRVLEPRIQDGRRQANRNHIRLAA